MIGATTLHGLLMQGGSIPPAGLGYGYLYNWYAASDANFAPTDWKVPTDTEYETLLTYLGGGILSGAALKEVGFIHWDSDNTDATNSSGFTALGSGWRIGSPSTFGLILALCTFWAKNEFDATRAYFMEMYSKSSDYAESGVTGRWNKYHGYSVRLLYTGTGTPPSTITDYDGNVYDVVQIGTQYWTVQNWKCTKLNNGTVIPNITDGAEWAGLTTGARCAYDNDENNV